MGNNKPAQAHVRTDVDIDPSQGFLELSFFNADGSPWTPDAGAVTPGVHVAQVTAANATDLTTAQTLANANKVAINAIITSLQTAGFLAAS